jgi:hypothetical protein
LNTKRIDFIFFGNSGNSYIKQNHIKIIKNAKKEIDLVRNYLIWNAKIERAVTCEYELRVYEVDSPEIIKNKLYWLRKKRDFFTKLLLIDHFESFEYVSLVSDDIIEFKVSNYPFPFFTSEQLVSKLEIKYNFQNSKFPSQMELQEYKSLARK